MKYIVKKVHVSTPLNIGFPNEMQIWFTGKDDRPQLSAAAASMSAWKLKAYAQKYIEKSMADDKEAWQKRHYWATFYEIIEIEEA